ncbi:N-alpha-acetyltransferase, non-catalitic subunit [Blastocladiella emersonii ATCC 22665]|nr:N-alpha-acetyltransferase, non-catalitic subunit [Blastocladiella emersonii ATCC 22665]
MPPKLAKPGSAFVDATDWLVATTSELDVGELVRSDSLLLYDAMLAIEIMSPKMDSGMALPSDAREPPHDAAFVARLPSLSVRETAATLLELFRAQATFLGGSGALSGTLFNSVYARHAAAGLPSGGSAHSLALRSFVRGALRASHHVVRTVYDIGIYEEEDFYTDRAALDLLDHTPDATVLGELRTTAEMLEYLINAGGMGAVDGDAAAQDQALVADVIHPLVELQRAWLTAFKALVDRKFDVAAEHLEIALECIEGLVLHESMLADLLPAAAWTRPPAQPPVDADAKAALAAAQEADAKRSWHLGFNPRALVKLFTHSPPRTVQWITLAESVQTWTSLLHRLLATTRIPTPPPSSAEDPDAAGPPTSPLPTDPMFTLFAHVRPWCGLSRAMFHFRLFPGSATVLGEPFRAWLARWVLETTGAPFLDLRAGAPALARDMVRKSVAKPPPGLRPMHAAAVTSPARIAAMEAQVLHQIGEMIDLVLPTLDGPVADLIRAFGYNPGRSRRLLAKVMRRLDETQPSLESADQELSALTADGAGTFYFATFTYALKLYLAVDQLESAVELELFAPREWAPMLVYLDYLLANYAAQLERQAKCREYAKLRMADVAANAAAAAAAPMTPRPRPRTAGPGGNKKKRAPSPSAGRATAAAGLLPASVDLVALPAAIPAALAHARARRDIAHAVLLIWSVVGPAMPEPSTSPTPAPAPANGDSDTPSPFAPPSPGGSGYGAELQYAQRFRAWRSLQHGPAPLAYAEVAGTVAGMRGKPGAALDQAAQALARAKAAINVVRAADEGKVVEAVLGAEKARVEVDALAAVVAENQAVVAWLIKYAKNASKPASPAVVKKPAPASATGKKGGKKGAAGKGKPAAAAAKQTAVEDEKPAEAATSAFPIDGAKLVWTRHAVYPVVHVPLMQTELAGAVSSLSLNGNTNK